MFILYAKSTPYEKTSESPTFNMIIETANKLYSHNHVPDIFRMTFRIDTEQPENNLVEVIYKKVDLEKTKNQRYYHQFAGKQFHGYKKR